MKFQNINTAPSGRPLRIEIMESVANREGIAVDAIMEALNVPLTDIQEKALCAKTVSNLAFSRHIERTNKERPYRYKITEKGKQAIAAWRNSPLVIEDEAIETDPLEAAHTRETDPDADRVREEAQGTAATDDKKCIRGRGVCDCQTQLQRDGTERMSDERSTVEEPNSVAGAETQTGPNGEDRLLQLVQNGASFCCIENAAYDAQVLRKLALWPAFHEEIVDWMFRLADKLDGGERQNRQQTS